MQPGKPTIFNIAGNKVGLSVVPQHVRVAGQTSTTPNKTVMLQGMSPLLHEMRKASPERTKKVMYGYTLLLCSRCALIKIFVTGVHVYHSACVYVHDTYVFCCLCHADVAKFNSVRR